MISLRLFFSWGQFACAETWKVLFCSGVLLGLTACPQDIRRAPSVLILAVENQDPEVSLCVAGADPQVQVVFNSICHPAGNNAVEFSSIQANHPQSAPSLASLLFGATPRDLNWKNSESTVGTEFESFAEKFHARGFATSFISSSPLFLRRTGLSQGFAYFEETHKVEAISWGRRSDQVIQNFFRWKTDIGPAPFFSVLTFSDLQFFWRKSLENPDEALKKSWVPFFRRLQISPEWNNTWVIMVGLSSSDKSDKLGPLSAVVKPPLGMSLSRSSAQLTEGHLDLALFSKMLLTQILDSSPGPSVSVANLLAGVGSKSNGNGSPAAKSSSPLADPDEFKGSSSAGNYENFWFDPAKWQQRMHRLESLSQKNSDYVYWQLLELLEQRRNTDFEHLVKTSKVPVDSTSYWERLLKNRKTQILSDPCLRMIDLKIYEGSGTRTCDSPMLLSLQNLIYAVDVHLPDARIRELRQIVIRNWLELRALRHLFIINRSLGAPMDFQIAWGQEILRVEMALHFPEMASYFNWLEKAEPSVFESRD